MVPPRSSLRLRFPLRPPASRELTEREAEDAHFDTRERLRDWVAAFVLAGLEPTVEAELQFSAGNGVDYFGEKRSTGSLSGAISSATRGGASGSRAIRRS